MIGTYAHNTAQQQTASAERAARIAAKRAELAARIAALGGTK